MSEREIVVAQKGHIRDAAFDVRQQVFCQEQGLFDGSDLDAHDEGAIHLAALADGLVVGTVRLYEREPGVWIGGRLAVLRGHRGGTGFRLVQRAVEEARRRGASVFLASVQSPNEPFFRRLGWHTVAEGQELRGMPHVIMEAPLWVRSQRRMGS
ncbi:MAG TPA: MSMEG_0567/Sll0786 family nitrogen starvation N-acetyltransferase [Thermoleophilia bacterium]|nr:MSMEG_0567/Sll0786 family nitrogen starvation N-acetyltransferase [Thermoleophilia bacterium]